MLRLAALALLAALAAQVTTHAQAPSDDTEGLEEELRLRFRLARRYFDTGRFREAAAEFEALYALAPLAELLFNLYLAHREAGELEAAREALSRFALAVDGDRRVAATARLLELDAAIARARQTTDATTAPEAGGSGSDEVPLELAPRDVAGPSNEGASEGANEGADEAAGEGGDAAEGTSQEVTGAQAVEPDDATSSLTAPSSRRRRAWRALGASALVLAIPTATMGIRALRLDAELDGICAGGCEAGYEAKQRTGRRLAIAADVSGVVTLGLAVAGLVTWLLGDDAPSVACGPGGCAWTTRF